MSVIGSSLETSALQAIQAQHVASKARDREKSQSAGGRRFNDLVELRVSGVETTDAARQLPQNDSEQAQREHQQQPDPEHHPAAAKSATPRIDLKA